MVLEYVYTSTFKASLRLSFVPSHFGATVVEIVSSVGWKGLKKVTLGFDVDFGPVCLLEDSSTDTKQWDYLEWLSTSPDELDWCAIHGGSRVYRKNNHYGLLALIGYRLRELDVILSKSPLYIGQLVTLKRAEDRSRTM